MIRQETQRAKVLITVLFFLWGFALNLNPILIPHLKKACQLTDSQSALIDSASYIAYFLMALPAGLFMKRFGYKAGITVGLVLFALGAFLFYPAAERLDFTFFLVALFVIAIGLTLLETAANPYITVLGDADSATHRLNLAQSFNGLAAFLAPLVGRTFILSGKTITSQQETLSHKEVHQFLTKEAAAVEGPFLVISGVALLIAILFWRTSLPDISDKDTQNNKADQSIFTEKNLILGVIAQFFYVGAQVCISSFFIRFSDRVAGIDEKTAALFLSFVLLGFMLGRFLGTYLMRFIAPPRLLAVYCLINISLLGVAVIAQGSTAVYALAGVEFFMSIMFPTIFALSIRGLGSNTKIGSSLIIMAIVGGAVFPVIMGWVSDRTTIQTAYLVPAICFLPVFLFALKNVRAQKVQLTVAH